MVAVGVLVVLIGVSQLSSGRPEERPAAEPGRASLLLLVGAVAAALAVTAIVAALVLPGPGGAPAKSAGPLGACNGSRSLCGRRLDEVVFAGTTTPMPPRTSRAGCLQINVTGSSASFATASGRS